MQKIFSTFFIACLITFHLFAQSPTWSWAQNNGGGASDYGYGTANDTFGNVYYCGTFYSNNAKFGTLTIPSAGLGDGFLCKYDASGNFLWVKTITGTSTEVCKKVAVSPKGDVFVTGYSEGNFQIDSNAYTSYGEADGFVAKYNSSGVLQWSNHFGGQGEDYSSSITVDSKGRCVVTGRFEKSINIGGITLTSQNDSLYDCYIAKFDKSGNVLWGTSAGGSINQSLVYSEDVHFNSSGDILLSGHYNGPATFGTTVLYSIDDAFLSKLNTNGKWQWTVDAGSHCYYTFLGTDNQSNIYVCGSFGAYGFNSVIQGIQLYPISDYLDVYLAKFNSSGIVQAVQTGGSTMNDYSGGIAVDGPGNVWMAGYIQGPSAAFGSKSFTSAGRDDIFVAGYDASLNIKWLMNAGSSDVDQARDLSYNGKSTLYLAGNFKKKCNFGSITVNASSPSADAFLAALSIAGTMKLNKQEPFDLITRVYPDPASDVLFVTSPLYGSGTYSIINSIGMVELKQTIFTDENQETSIDISSLRSGIYFLVIQVNGTNSIAKFMKE